MSIPFVGIECAAVFQHLGFGALVLNSNGEFRSNAGRILEITAPWSRRGDHFRDELMAD